MAYSSPVVWYPQYYYAAYPQYYYPAYYYYPVYYTAPYVRPHYDYRLGDIHQLTPHFDYHQ